MKFCKKGLHLLSDDNRTAANGCKLCWNLYLKNYRKMYGRKRKRDAYRRFGGAAGKNTK